MSAAISRAPSYASGTGAEPLVGLTVSGLLDAAAAGSPDGEALVDCEQNRRASWSELRHAARAVGAGLLRLGLEPGDRIGILAPNRAEWVEVQFGTAYAGLILVNINPAYRQGELEYALAKTGCRALVMADRFKSSDYIAMLRELCPELDDTAPGELESRRLPELEILIRLGDEHSPGFFNYGELVVPEHDLDGLDEIGASLDADDPINIQFTSGTTGTPKAATLTHHNIVNNACIAAGILRLSAHDRVCIPVPMYHCFGMVLGSLLATARGAAMVFPSAGFAAGAVLEAVDREHCTVLHGVPTMFIALLDAPAFERCDTRSLRTGIMAGAPCPVELMRRVMRDLHLAEITIGYGMTETGPLSTETAVDDPIEARVASVGRVLPHTEIKIVDEAGRIVPRGTPGELCTRGYCVMRGYWGDPEKTAAEIDAAHWIKSGDIASMDDAGYVSIVGRIKDMVIRGGENIYPREIEEFLYGNPKIAEVEVFGVPDPKYGEEVAAWIKLHDGERATADEIREYCHGRIAHYKIPRYVKFVDAFPLTVTGKVQKYLMREQMAAELGRNAAVMQ